jgi:anti-anti-sigma factor
MGDTTEDGVGRDATQEWLTAAQHAELGDLTSTAPVRGSAAVSVRSEAGVRVVQVAGALATGSAAYLDVVLEQEISTARAAVVVDLSDVAFVGVRGIATLVRAAGRAADNRTALCLVPPIDRDFGRHIDALGLSEMFDVHMSVDDCRSALAAREPRSGPAALPGSAGGARRAPTGHGAAELPASHNADLTIVVERADGVVVVRLSGPLSLRTVGSVATALAKLLLDGGRVLVDLSAVRLRWAPALQVFPSTLAAVGGWPTARLVLLDAGEELAATIRALRIDRVVPLARGLPEARALLERRPALVIRYHELAHGPGAPRRARALLRSACTDWHIDPLAPDAAVVATELVTNAVRHAGTSCRLVLRLDDVALHIAVRDHHVADDATLARLQAAPASGGGLRIVAAFTRAYGVTPNTDGKTVWALIDLHRAD